MQLVLAWSATEPDRAGEVLVVPPAGGDLGRGSDTLTFERQRPGASAVTGPLAAPSVSRRQVRIERTRAGFLVENTGRAPVHVRGRTVGSAELGEGDALGVGSDLVLLSVRRPRALPAWPASTPWPDFPFGRADAFGFVGESPAMWRLRERIMFAAGRDAHVLVVGPSGSGKEAAAQAIHLLGPRGARPMVSRSAATFPESLIDAELFGNPRGFPNPGMPERPGLVGEADGSTLFLDELGELRADLQARLLRVLDDGEYQRLGESRRRRARFRFVGATNRDPSELKHDLLARLPIRVHTPGLGGAREDAILLFQHLARRIISDDPALVRQIGTSEPRLSSSLALALLLRNYTAHARELEAILWEALARWDGRALRLPGQAPPPSRPPEDIGLEELRACLERNAGKREATWRELGLASRHVLTRLVRRHGLADAGD